MFNRFPEFLSNRTVNDEVDRGIEDKSKVVEASKTEEPVGRDEMISTPKLDICQKINFLQRHTL